MQQQTQIVADQDHIGRTALVGVGFGSFRLSNGFVEGINNKLKMIKRTIYGRCGGKLLAAKLMQRM